MVKNITKVITSLIIIQKTFESTLEFVINKYATPFITIDVTNHKSIEGCIEYIEKKNKFD